MTSPFPAQKGRLATLIFGLKMRVEDFFQKFFARLVQDKDGIEYGSENGKKVREFPCENKE